MAQERLLFATRAAFRQWLIKNHQASPGIWLVFGKGDQGKTLTANEALAEALCFGWIDGQLQSVDAQRYLKKFTPRRPASVWSARNRGLAEQLIAAGQMTAAGHAAIARAKAHGTWDAPAAAPISDAQIAVLTAALAGHEPAVTNFARMSPSVRRTYAAGYLAAKQDATRARRLAKIIARLDANLKPM